MRGSGPAKVSATWPRRMAQLHPAWLLLVTLLAFAGQMASVSATPQIIILASVCVLGAMSFLLGWTYAIYRVARDVSAKNNIEQGPNRSWVFRLAAVAILVLPIGLLDLPPVLAGLRDLVGGVVVLPFFASYWLAAGALVTAEGHPVRYPTNKAVGTFLLVFYSFIGAWYLRPRIRAVLEAPPAEEPVRLD
jgi:hypothetical protein